MDIRSLIQKAKEVCKRTSENAAAKTMIEFVAKYKVAFAIISAVSVMVMLMSMVLIIKRDVKIYVDGELEKSFSTLEQKPEKWLEAAGVKLYSQDRMTVEETSVYIERAFYITVTADGKDTVMKTTPHSVAEVLARLNITLSDTDEISHESEKIIEQGDHIIVYRKTSKNITKTKTIEYKTVEKKTDSLYVGEEKVETKGENGKKELTYEVIYTDGKETDRKLVSEKVIKEAVDKVVLVGTKKVPTVQTSSTPTKYKKVISMRATAYTYGEDGGNITATGIRPYKGIVAVDPKVIPLGTKLYIESADGKYIYGTAVAADTGGAIKGNKIDLFLNSEAECRKFGRRTVNVYIID